MSSIRIDKKRFRISAAASAASLALVSSAFAQSNVGANQVVISAAGSTALKNWIVANTTTFTDIQPGTTLSINGTSYPLASDPSGGGTNFWTNGGISYQLAPKNNTSTQGTGIADASPAIQFIYHESGAVEGPLELVNDQVGAVPYITANVDRNPEGGNAVWLNYNQIGASGLTAGAAFNAGTGANAGNGLTLGNFYGPGVGQAATAGATNVWVPGSASNPTPTFNTAGVNVNGGQNAVQFALSDEIPQQAFKNDYGNQSNTFVTGTGTVTVNGANNNTFSANSLDQGYGGGNTSLTLSPLGTKGGAVTYQSPSLIDAPATAINPHTGAAFGVGPWNNAAKGGLGNINNQLMAITATPMVSNPGTGLTEINRSDADWLNVTSRLANGAEFNMTTRDTGSGTRNDFANNTGVDPSWASGKDDAGNGNLTNGVNNAVFDQESIGPAQHFSNKTAGGAQLRPTVINNRMAVGTLSINDSKGHDTQGVANPVRVLSYADTASGYANPVSPNYATISNGTFALYQQEEVFTIKDMSSVAAYNASGVTIEPNGAQDLTGTIQGDDASGDVVAVLNNTANSVATANAKNPLANPADGLLSQGYIIPQLMQVFKNVDGQGLVSAPGQIATGSIVSQSNLPANGGSFNQTLYNSYAANGGFGQSSLPDLTTQQPTTGTGSTYGGGGATFAIGNSVLNGGRIAITNTNYLFGNFNQNGDRDFNAVKSALNADEALITLDQGVSASVPGSEFTSVGDNNLNWNGGTTAGGTNGILNTASVTYTDALGNPHTVTKGDLIVMGDFLGTGHFDGASLVAMAEGAALSDNYSTDRLTVSPTMYQTGVLNKNAAMDYMNSNIPQVGAVGANATTDYIRTSGRAILEASSVPFGATAVTNLVSGLPVTDPVTGHAEFSYDPNGVNTFNKSDVQQSGLVDFNSAVAVDNVVGLNPSTLADQATATQLAPVTGQTIPLNLYMAQQVDGGGAISQADVNVINAAMTGVGGTNWYNGGTVAVPIPLVKTGSSTITWARTGGTVTVYPGATFDIKSGTVQIGGTEDPFTDNNAAGPGSTAGNHVTVNVGDANATLQLTQNFGTVAVAGLTVNTASNSVVDLGNNAILIDYGTGADPIASIEAWIKSGANLNGLGVPTWTGAGINSSVAAENPGIYGIGYADSADPGNPAGLAPGQVKVMYTLLGDANLDGKVNGTDFNILAANFNTGGDSWDQGDFTYDGKVNGSDFNLLAQNFNQGLGNGIVPFADAAALASFAAANGITLSGVTSSVPEPATASLLAIAGVGILSRRRRKN